MSQPKYCPKCKDEKKENPSKLVQLSQKLHLCPYLHDIHDDEKTKCYCCEQHEHECAMEI